MILSLFRRAEEAPEQRLDMPSVPSKPAGNDFLSNL
jgi:hypothetical protein